MIKKILVISFALFLLLIGFFSYVLVEAKISQIAPTGYSIFTEYDVNISVRKVPEDIKSAFEYINRQRVIFGKSRIVWDDRAYNLAVDRAKDMYERSYFDHVDPDGLCAKDLKMEYGFLLKEILAENIGEVTHYTDGSPVVNTDAIEPVNYWLESRGHRFNLLYDDHESGAIGCYKYICVFYGVHRNLFGLWAVGCVSGEEGSKFWEESDELEGEII